MSTHRGAVVVGLDAGPDSRHGLVWAADAAVRLNRPLHLMHAIDGGSYEVPPTVAEARRLHERAEQLLADASAAVASSVADISTQIVERSPVPALLDASRDAAVVVLSPERALAVHARAQPDGSWACRRTADPHEVGESARMLLTRAAAVERDTVLALG